MDNSDVVFKYYGAIQMWHIAIVLCRHLRGIQVQYTKSHLSPDEIKCSYVNCITMVLI